MAHLRREQLNNQKNTIDQSIVWDEDPRYNYHILGKQNWEKVNDLIRANKHRDPHMPVTFGDNVIVNHIRTQLTYEIKRFESRNDDEVDPATHWWRSSYPKYIVWHYLMLATIDQRMISCAQLTRRSGLSRSGVTNILIDAGEMDYVNQKKHKSGVYYCASNLTMQGYVYRLRREAGIIDPDFVNHYYTFKQFLSFIGGDMAVDRILEDDVD